MVSNRLRSLIATACALPAAAACSSSSNNTGSPAATTPDASTLDGGGSTSTSDADSQTPPTGAANVEAWLATGAYKNWHCETAVHASRSPSVHNFNRICSNDLVSANAAPDAGDWAAGAAAVKELYQSITDTTPVGYAVYLKTSADSDMGANWYWYERVPLTGTQAAAPHDPTTGVVADGLGDAGTPLSICVGCHGAAGSDTAHTPSVGGRDFVYTPVQ